MVSNQMLKAGFIFYQKGIGIINFLGNKIFLHASKRKLIGIKLEKSIIHNSKSPRLAYIENMRILLTALVVIVHVACSYGGPGGWIYMEKGAGLATVLPLTVLNATSQSFFMGMFFFIAAYFTHRSFQKKGLFRFVKDRIIRLGIPLLLSYYFINVLTTIIVLPVKYPKSAGISFIELWKGGHAFGVGVMWFVLALIYFTVLYLIAYLVIPGLRIKNNKPMPEIKSMNILITAILLGIVTFLVRIIFPLFEGYYSLPFVLGHFPQYIFLFVLGIIAAKYDSDYFVSYAQAKKWMWFSLVLILFVFPLLFFIGNVNENGIESFLGGVTLESLILSVWEQVTGISIMVALFGIFKTKWNKQNNLTKKLSDSAYAVYVLHPPVLVVISVVFINWKVMLLLKFLALTPIALIFSFGIAIIVKQIPLLKRIF